MIGYKIKFPLKENIDTLLPSSGLYFQGEWELSLAWDALLNYFIAKWYIAPLHDSTDPWKAIIKLSW